MKHEIPTADVGVIVGRFQVAELHEGHRNLIDSVVERHRKVIIVLGLAPVANTGNNPLDFESRKQMLLAEYPQANVLYVMDVNNDEAWSKALDKTVGDIVSPTQSVLLYGSRDSFIQYYTGRYDTYELPDHHATSGTEVRMEIARQARDSADWRAGVIWASRNRWPTCFTTVDVAIFSPDYSRILLGKKAHEKGWRLIGGFTDPGSKTLEEDVKREAEEEASVTLKGITYVRSFTVDDWRYSKELDSIKTVLFAGTTEDEGVAGDDIAEVAWFDTEEFDANHMWKVVEIHRPLLTYALLYAGRERKQ